VPDLQSITSCPIQACGIRSSVTPSSFPVQYDGRVALTTRPSRLLSVF
jgi:hypothetical protein